MQTENALFECIRNASLAVDQHKVQLPASVTKARYIAQQIALELRLKTSPQTENALFECVRDAWTAVDRHIVQLPRGVTKARYTAQQIVTQLRLH